MRHPVPGGEEEVQLVSGCAGTDDRCTRWKLHAAVQVTRVAAESPTRAPCIGFICGASCDLFSEISIALMLCMDFIFHFTLSGGGGELFSLVYDKGRAI